jgi:hypothetical protein
LCRRHRSTGSLTPGKSAERGGVFRADTRKVAADGSKSMKYLLERAASA